jgi:hypothetical protein
VVLGQGNVHVLINARQARFHFLKRLELRHFAAGVFGAAQFAIQNAQPIVRGWVEGLDG